MTSEELSAYREIGGAIGAIAMTAVLAWRARGRKDRSEPYSVDKESQPRVVTRKEWHDVIDVVNAFPGLSARVKRNELRLDTLEDDFQEHMRIANEQAQDFADFRGRWEEVGREAREHRQRLENHILRVEGKVDAGLRNGKQNGSA